MNEAFHPGENTPVPGNFFSRFGRKSAGRAPTLDLKLAHAVRKQYSGREVALVLDAENNDDRDGVLTGDGSWGPHGFTRLLRNSPGGASRTRSRVRSGLRASVGSPAQPREKPSVGTGQSAAAS